VTSGAYTDEIEQSTLEGVRKNIEPYGVEIIRFGDFTISMDQADKERLDKPVDRRACGEAMGARTGGMAEYRQLAQPEMMMGAAEGRKKGGDGGGAFQGAGIGLGFAMAGNMSNMMGNANAQHPRAPAESKDQIMAMLKQLGELKAAGILTDAEFDAKKKELLAKL